MAQTTQMQVGLELEVLAPTLSRYGYDLYPGDSRYMHQTAKGEAQDIAMYHVHAWARDLLHKHIFPTVMTWELKEAIDNPDALMRLANQKGVNLKLPGPEPQYRFCQIEIDNSVVPDPYMLMGDYSWVNMEVITPVMDAVTTAPDVIWRICSLLRENGRFVTPQSAGVHIHISETPRPTDSWTGGMRLVTFQKFLSLILVAEGTLYRMCAPHRKNEEVGPSLTENLWDKVERCRHQPAPTVKMNRHVPANLETNLRRLLAMIWQQRLRDGRADDDAGLCHLQRLIMSRNLTRCSVAMKPVDVVDDRGRKECYTIEMRHLESTLDPELINRWMGVCVRLLEISADSGPGEFGRLLGSLVALNTVETGTPMLVPDYGGPRLRWSADVADFLSAVGLGDSATVKFWRRKMRVSPQPQVLLNFVPKM